jgi:hypothetical protein
MVMPRELRDRVDQQPHFDAGHDYGKQTNEFAAHEQPKEQHWKQDAKL